MKVIAQRELRNDISRILREVAAGERFRVTVAGRPVAELSPIESGPLRFVPRERYERILKEAPLDAGFTKDIDDAIGMTVDEL